MSYVKVLASVAALSLAACESLPVPVQNFSAPFFGQGDGDPKVAALPKGAVTRIAFGSCADQNKPQPFWNVIGAQDPDLFLLIGDAVYADWRDGEYHSEVSPDDVAYAYSLLGAKKPFQRFRAKVPMLVAWDDHDMGKNDAGGEFPFKQQSKDIMLDFFGVPTGSSLADREGMYQAHIFGEDDERVQVILLDTRWFRSPLKVTDERGAKGKERYLPDPDEAKTMLGEAQWAWLEDQLKQPADVRLLVSSQQVIADNHGWEAWRNLPLERQRLYDLIDKTGAEGVVVLSGDRHVGGFYQNSEDTPYPLFELTSSPLNLAFRNEPDESGPHQIGWLYGPGNFGIVDINWETQVVDLRLLNDQGAQVRGLTLPIETLRRPHPTMIAR